MSTYQHRLIPTTTFFILFGAISTSTAETDSPPPFEHFVFEEIIISDVISASKKLENINLAPATIYAISGDEIRNFGYSTLEEVLKNTPGVTPINLGFFLFGGQRGLLGNFSQTLILINGREMQNLIAAETFISSQFATHNIKQIEIINGPGSALYGANAFSGVINIITKSNSLDYEGIELELELGSEETRGYSVVVGKQFGDLRIGGSIKVWETDGYDFNHFVNSPSQFSEGFPQVAQSSISSHLQLEDYQNHHRAEPISFEARYKDFYIGSESYHLRTGKGLENVSLDYNAQRDERRLSMYYAGWEHAFNSQYRLSIDLKHYKERFWGINYSYTQERFDQLIADTGRDPNAPITQSEVRQYFTDVYSQKNSDGSSRDRADLQLEMELGEKWDLIFGYTYDDLDVLGLALSSDEASPPFDHTVSPDNPMHRPFYLTTKKSLYFQLQKPFWRERLNLTLGIRQDDHSIYGGVINYRSGLVLKAGEDTYLKLLYGEAFREPNIFEQGAQLPANIPPNTDLDPAEIETWELSAIHTWFNKVKANVTVFQSEISDTIKPVTTLTFENSEDTRTIRGAEARLQYLLGSFSGDFSLTYLDPDDDLVNGKKVSTLNNYENRASFGVSYGVNRHLKLSARVNYFGEIEAEHGNPSIDSTFIIDSATTVDFTALVHNLKSDDLNVQFTLDIKNLLDEEYFQPNVRNGGPKQFMQPGRQFRTSVLFSL